MYNLTIIMYKYNLLTKILILHCEFKKIEIIVKYLFI